MALALHFQYSLIKKLGIFNKKSGMKNWILSLFLLTTFFCLRAQEDNWFYIRAKDTLVEIPFQNKNGQLIYSGNDQKLKGIFKNYKISAFKKTFRKAKKEDLKRTFFVIADKPGLLQELLAKTPRVFTGGEEIASEDKKIFEPNDYGSTSTIGTDKGLYLNQDYYDFLGVPEAWYYTTGDPKTIIGISDAIVDITNAEFKFKTTVIQKPGGNSYHGSAVAEIAAGQGNNGYGSTGICYDCSIYSTTYGYFSDLKTLMELSKLGVKVINCSWALARYYDTAQTVIDEMFENGTVIVASAGNGRWSTDQGEKKYYPASYNHVISVSSGMYKYDKVSDNINRLDEGIYYAANIKGYVGRTMGFPDNDTLKQPYIYPISIRTLNDEVDILTPTTGVLLFSDYITKGKIEYQEFETTSIASPQVTGTIGLMLSLYPCLPIDEVESILKMTSMNIDIIPANKPYQGYYGSGLLQTGKAVKMVYDMFAMNKIAIIENQKFSRWDFKVTANNPIRIQNQEFTENATLQLTSKDQIIIGENTVLRPNATGSLHFKIDPKLKKECDLVLRDPSIND